MADCVYQWNNDSEIQYTEKWITGLDNDMSPWCEVNACYDGDVDMPSSSDIQVSVVHGKKQRYGLDLTESTTNA